MKNNSHRISANEINRYVYCNFQWYYRRYYGDATLTKLRKERNKTLGIQSDSRTHAFVKGTKFHNTYHRWYQVKRLMYRFIVLAMIIIALWFAWKGFR